ncbi:MAG: lmo0937 family membrane protein [Nitrososphaerota archaeon]|nr:lmo0937 family membrane protein [Nitrososphaerota archaeon]MDG6946008.1 lmo0937 family membrane protein [Nitrososphaerota archaeon]MDG6950098.1 lmo0937 family membrane protein [Nitrososphaerota archaeon]
MVVLWLFGFIGGIGGELINLLLIVAVIVVLYRFFTGRNVVTGKAT